MSQPRIRSAVKAVKAVKFRVRSGCLVSSLPFCTSVLEKVDDRWGNVRILINSTLNCCDICESKANLLYNTREEVEAALFLFLQLALSSSSNLSAFTSKSTVFPARCVADISC
jgi:hypothetical protein